MGLKYIAFILFIMTGSSYAAEALFTLYNYDNMPKAVAVFQSKSRTFVGVIEIHSSYPLTCTHTEKGSKDSQPIVNTKTLDGEDMSFSPQRYMDHDITCALKNKIKDKIAIDINVTYSPEVLPDPSDEKRAQVSLNDWLKKVKTSQDLLKLDAPPSMCESKTESPSLKVETGFIYRMTQGGEACTTPVSFTNGNILSFCSKKMANGDYAMEARAFSPQLKPLLKSVIADVETDTLRPKLLKTKLNKELIVIHSISGKLAGIDSTGKAAFDVQLPVSWIGTPVIKDDLIYVTSQDEGENLLFILNSTGKIILKNKIEGETFSAPLILENQILIGNNKAQLLLLDLKGETIQLIELAKKLSYPGGQIGHLFKNSVGEILLATNKGEIAKIDVSGDLTTLYLAPNDGERLKMGKIDRDREILDAPVVTSSGLMAFSTDSRLHLLNPDGSLNQIVETGNEFSIQSAVGLFNLKGEEHFWLGSMGMIYIIGQDGLKKMEFSPFETNQSESMAENYSNPLVLPDGRVLAGVYQGLRYFKLSISPKPIPLQNFLSRTCE